MSLRIVDLPATGTIAINDVLETVDVSDTSDDPTGSSIQRTVEAIRGVLDEDAFTSFDPTRPPSQQSTKVYVDAAIVAALVNAPIICKWNGSAWVTLGGASVPTTSTLVRWYDSSDDPAATAPTYYNVLDKWYAAA